MDFVEWGKNHHGHVSNELEEAASDYDSRHCALYAEDDEGDIVEITEVREIAFINGALWQKQQMMKDAVDGHIRRNKYTKKNVLNGLDVVCEAVQKFKDGDKLKIIFVKEE